LARIGAHPIDSLGDHSASAEIAGSLYDTAVDGILAAHPWRACIRTVDYSTPDQTDLPEYDYGFVLPSDCLRVISAGPSGQTSGIRYAIRGGHILTNNNTVTVVYIARIGPADMPPHLAGAVIARLSAELTIPITESTSRAEAMHRLADDRLESARRMDGQMEPPQHLSRFPLIDARGE
jgi:hypothetical protein